MLKLHLDTDLGGDIDDLCALAMALNWPDVDLLAVTTNSDDQGRRAGYTRYALGLAGRDDVPVAAGADAALGCYRVWPGLPDEALYWPEPVKPAPAPLEEALTLLERSIEQGALIVAIGAFTNLALLEKRSPGILRHAKLTLMGGYVFPPREGFPSWGNDMDWNIQEDVQSAYEVIQHSNPTLVPLTITIETALRRAHLPALRAAGPLACAIALGWRDGVEICEVPLTLEVRDGWLYEKVNPAGQPTRVVTRIDGNRFNDFWINTVAGKNLRVPVAQTS